MEGPLKYPDYTHVALEISDYESVERQIKEMNIAITGRVEFEGAKCFFIRDPDGNVIEFHQPANGKQVKALRQRKRC